MKTVYRIRWAAWITLVAILGTGRAQAQIEWRVSVKFILSASGNLPAGGGGYGASSAPLTNNQAVIDQVRRANQVLDQAGRGYRFQLTEIVNLAGVSQFFNAPARSSANRIALEAAAMADKATYAWRDDALNIYINNTSSGYCSIPGDHNIIFLGATAYDTLLLHESGHFFNLLHTHEGEDFRNADSSGCSQGCGCARLLGGNGDLCADTLADNECWSRDAIAAGNFGGLSYSQLNGSQQGQVDNVFLNVMSYHIPQGRLTSCQMDRMADASNDSRAAVATGSTRFVDPNGTFFFQFGSSDFPYLDVATGVNNANPGDIVLLRPAQYNEPGTYTKPVTFRATRGPATIGVP